jgi:hypothetical protein
MATEIMSEANWHEHDNAEEEASLFIDQQYVFDHLPLNKEQRLHLYQVLTGVKSPTPFHAHTKDLTLNAIKSCTDLSEEDRQVLAEADLQNKAHPYALRQHMEQPNQDTCSDSRASADPSSCHVSACDQTPPELEPLKDLSLTSTSTD